MSFITNESALFSVKGNSHRNRSHDSGDRLANVVEIAGAIAILVFTVVNLREKTSLKLTYFPDADTLYIDLADRPIAESEGLNENLIIDLDNEGRPVGITVRP